eukprot:SAG11_NODE_1221_length_5486_cov_7.177650_4_plen_77_part_00
MRLLWLEELYGAVQPLIVCAVCGDAAAGRAGVCVWGGGGVAWLCCLGPGANPGGVQPKHLNTSNHRVVNCRVAIVL